MRRGHSIGWEYEIVDVTEEAKVEEEGGADADTDLDIDDVE